MRRVVAAVAVVAFALVAAPARTAGWGADYFPNVELTTHEGETVRFFDDLIEDRVVLVNFIYTTCVDVCPMETAQLIQVQRILGDRLGKDVFFYSITIDPEHDTPAVLADYRDRFRAKWTFLTGDDDDITLLRKKLGLYIEEIQDGSNNHNVNMVIGNQATGRWMKRSPFENPYVLADQIGNWLHGYKAPPRKADYSTAPELRNVSAGERLFRTRCSSCHTIDGNEPEDAIGPDLVGVTDQRDPEWLLNWLRAPDQMLEAKDPIAMALYRKYNQVPMPNLRLNRQEADDLIEYIAAETRYRNGMAEEATASSVPASDRGDVVAVMNAWVRATDPGARANGGYMTLFNATESDLRLTAVSSRQFERVEMHEMAVVDGMMKMRKLDDVVVPAAGSVKFAPGGQHLMMHRPVGGHLVAGASVDLTLEFDDGSQQSLTVRVEAR